MILLFFERIISHNAGFNKSTTPTMDYELMAENSQLRQELDRDHKELIRVRDELDRAHKELDRVREELKHAHIKVVDATLYASEVYQLYSQARDQLTRKRQPFSAPKTDFTKL